MSAHDDQDQAQLLQSRGRDARAGEVRRRRRLSFYLNDISRIKWRRDMEERRKQAKEKEKEMAKLRAQADQHYTTTIFLFTFTILCQKNKEWRLRRESRVVNEAESENDSVSSGNEDLERALRFIFHTSGHN